MFGESSAPESGSSVGSFYCEEPSSMTFIVLASNSTLPISIDLHHGSHFSNCPPSPSCNACAALGLGLSLLGIGFVVYLLI
jgi:hypothetical protein